MPQGWTTQEPLNVWNEQSVVEAKKAYWPDFVRSLEGAGPLNMDYWPQNTLMCYAYVLTLAARKKDSLSVLDWGSGEGCYYLISRTLLPDVRFEYHCYDVPLLCQLGRSLLSEVNFHESAADVFQKQYDLVLASGSLQYFEDWSNIVHKLATATRGFLYITRLPILHRVGSFVFVQRSYGYGYRTGHLGWFLNRREFLKSTEKAALDLVREFVIYERPFVHGAPEQGEIRGFLFRPRDVVKE